MMAVTEPICPRVKHEFLPFLPHLIPAVLNKSVLSPRKYDERSAPTDGDDLSVAVVPGGDGEAVIMVLNFSEVEDFQHAVECVHTFLGN